MSHGWHKSWEVSERCGSHGLETACFVPYRGVLGGVWEVVFEGVCIGKRDIVEQLQLDETLQDEHNDLLYLLNTKFRVSH